MTTRSMWPIIRGITCALLVVFLIAPMVIVVVISFSSAPFLTFPPPGFSLQWYEKMIRHEAWVNSLTTSLLVMGPTGVIATVLGTTAALAIVRGRFPGSSVLLSLLMAPLVVPVIIVAAALFGVFRTWGIFGSIWALIIAHTVLTIPYVLSTVMASLQLIDEQLEKAALTLGADPWQAFWRITFPLLLPALVSGMLFAMIVSFDELVVSLFISTPTVRTATVQMWSDIRGDADPTISAIGTVLFLFSLLVLLADSLLRPRAEKRTGGGM